MTTTEILLWDVLPYVAITTFVVGTIWRYRYDKFGWTTRSSQLYERKLIRIASPLFHLGILAVLMGHIVGLLIPESWTQAIGLSESLYHAMAVGLGLFAGVATLVGIVLLCTAAEPSGRCSPPPRRTTRRCTSSLSRRSAWDLSRPWSVRA